MLSKKAHVYVEAKKQVDMSRDRLDLYNNELSDNKKIWLQKSMKMNSLQGILKC